VEPDPAGRGLLEGEGERVEDLRCAEPDVPVEPGPDARAERVAPDLTQSAACPVCGHHEVRRGQLGRVGLALEPQIHAEVVGAFGEDLEEAGTADAVAVPPEVGGAVPG
jgi:hypothetical protein